MAIALPTSPEPCAPFTPPTVMSLRNDVISLVGGNRQRKDRKGDHYRSRFTMPRLTYEEARVWRRLMKGDTVVMQLPQPDIVIPAPGGTPRVNGANQLGTTLNVDGLGAGYVLKEGQMISVLTAGRNWTFALDADVTANGSGQAALPLQVMIRTLHADNDLVEIVNPVIEGFSEFDDDAFAIDDNGYVRLAFEIEERG